MELDPNDIKENSRTPIQLFNDGIKADVTRLDYTNKLKKVLCEFMAKILKYNDLIKKFLLRK